jgi:chitodextrinase
MEMSLPKVPEVTVTTATATDTVAPTTPSGYPLSNTTVTTSLSWSASSDNVGVAGYRKYSKQERDSQGTSYSVTGLTPVPRSIFTVAAFDADEMSLPKVQVTVTTATAT